MRERIPSRLKELAKEEAGKQAESAKREMGKQAESAKREMGEIIIDATGEYFPHEMRARRRRDMARGFAIGVGAGVAAHYAMSRHESM